jgi:nucleotide-binding universal stress UspA family protein
MGRIVVPFDGGYAGTRMLTMACDTARLWDSEVEVVYVLRIPPQVPIDADLPAARERADAIFARAYNVAADAATRVPLAVTTVLIEARHVATGLVVAAEGADLLMMGLPDRRRLVRRVLFTPTLRYVLAHAPCEVLVGYVPPIAPDVPVSRFLHARRAPVPPSARMPDNVRVLRTGRAGVLGAPHVPPHPDQRSPVGGVGRG